MPPKNFQHYQIVSELGSGGMGLVYKAYDPRQDRYVALKVLIVASEESQKRFDREARAIAKLDHLGIVKFYEVGEERDRCFFTMEYIEGPSLKEWCSDQLPTMKKIAGVMKEICLAVHYAHRNGIIHRDLKPSNVMMHPNGHPVVMDFGLAKSLQDTRISQTGAVIGTLQYMPPEQASGNIHEVDHLSDVYSLGALLYEMLTGRPPFGAGNQSKLKTLYQIAEKAARLPTRLNPKVPPPLEAICLKAISKSKADRYQSAIEMAEDLNNFLQRKSTTAKIVQTKKRKATPKPLSFYYLVALMLMIAGISISFLLQENPSKESRNKHKNLTGKHLEKNNKDSALEPNTSEKSSIKDNTNPQDIEKPTEEKISLLKQQWESSFLPVDVFPSLKELRAHREELLLKTKKISVNQGMDKVIQKARLYQELGYHRDAIRVLQRIPNKNLEHLWLITQSSLLGHMRTHARFYLDLMKRRYPKNTFQKEGEIYYQKLLIAENKTFLEQEAFQFTSYLANIRLADIEQDYSQNELYFKKAHKALTPPVLRPWKRWLQALVVLEMIRKKQFPKAKVHLQNIVKKNTSNNLWKFNYEHIFLEGILLYYQGEGIQSKINFEKIANELGAGEELAKQAKLYLQRLSQPDISWEHLREASQTILNSFVMRGYIRSKAFAQQGNFNGGKSILLPLLSLEGQWLHMTHYRIASISIRAPDFYQDKILVYDTVHHFSKSRLYHAHFNDPIFHLGIIAGNSNHHHQARLYFSFIKKNPAKWTPGSEKVVDKYFRDIEALEQKKKK